MRFTNKICKIINKKDEYINDSTINFDYIFSEIKEKNKFNYLIDINNKNNKLYLLRIWCRYTNKYVYKLGRTTNIINRISQINTNFDCCGKIILILLVEIDNEFVELNINEILKNHKINKSMINPIKPKSKEIFKISRKFYDLLFDILDDNYPNYFESQIYVIEEDNSEHIMYNINNISFFNKYVEYFTYDEFIDLSNKYLETIYWINMRLN